MQLVLTVQGLINSKPCFLGYLIRNSWSHTNTKTCFRNSSSDFVAGKNLAQQAQIEGRKGPSQPLGPDGGAGERQLQPVWDA